MKRIEFARGFGTAFVAMALTAHASTARAAGDGDGYLGDDFDPPSTAEMEISAGLRDEWNAAFDGNKAEDLWYAARQQLSREVGSTGMEIADGARIRQLVPELNAPQTAFARRMMRAIDRTHVFAVAGDAAAMGRWYPRLAALGTARHLAGGGRWKGSAGLFAIAFRSDQLSAGAMVETLAHEFAHTTRPGRPGVTSDGVVYPRTEARGELYARWREHNLLTSAGPLYESHPPDFWGHVRSHRARGLSVPGALVEAMDSIGYFKRGVYAADDVLDDRTIRILERVARRRGIPVEELFGPRGRTLLAGRLGGGAGGALASFQRTSALYGTLSDPLGELAGRAVLGPGLRLVGRFAPAGLRGGFAAGARFVPWLGPVILAAAAVEAADITCGGIFGGTAEWYRKSEAWSEAPYAGSQLFSGAAAWYYGQ